MFQFDIKYIKKHASRLSLSERERKILDYRLGLTDNVTHTLEETGKIFGVTRERVRQIEKKAIDKIANSYEIKSS